MTARVEHAILNVHEGTPTTPGPRGSHLPSQTKGCLLLQTRFVTSTRVAVPCHKDGDDGMVGETRVETCRRTITAVTLIIMTTQDKIR